MPSLNNASDVITGPVLFAIAQLQNDAFTSVFQNVFFGSSENLFFGPSGLVFLGITSWYLGAGFFLPLAAGVIGVASAK